METVLNFLEGAEKYHGAFPIGMITQEIQSNLVIWMMVDIVETALLIQGLLIVRQYFSNDNEQETELRNRITNIWEDVEWTWYTQGQNKITWHWSPTHNFAINLDV